MKPQGWLLDATFCGSHLPGASEAGTGQAASVPIPRAQTRGAKSTVGVGKGQTRWSRSSPCRRCRRRSRAARAQTPRSPSQSAARPGRVLRAVRIPSPPSPSPDLRRGPSSGGRDRRVRMEGTVEAVRGMLEKVCAARSWACRDAQRCRAACYAGLNLGAKPRHSSSLRADPHVVGRQGLLLDSGHGLVHVPPWALQMALFVGLGTNVLVLGSIAIGRLFTFRVSRASGARA